MIWNLAAAGSLLLAVALLIYGIVNWRRSGLPPGLALRTFLAPPAYLDPADNRRASLLNALIQAVTVAVCVCLPVIALLRRDESSLNLVALAGWSFDANLALYLMARHGRLRLACWLYPAAMFVLDTVGLFLGTGAGGLASFTIIVVTAALLLGGPGALVYAALGSLMLPATQFAERLGAPLLGLPSGLAEWLEYVAIFFVAAILLRMLTLRFEANVRHAERLQAMQAERSRDLDRSLGLERKRARQLELLADSARRLTGINDPAALLDEATHRLVEGFSFEHAAVFLVEDDRLVVHSARGALSVARPLGSVLNLGEGVVGAVGRDGQTAWVRAASPGNDFPPAPGVAVASVVAVPLRLAKSVVGVLEVASTRAEAIEDTDVRTLESLADLIAAGLQASQLFIQLRSRQLSSEALRRIGAAVNQSLDLPQIVRTVCYETSPAFDADRVEVWLLEGGSPGRLQRAAECTREGRADRDLERRGLLLAPHLGSGRAHLLGAGPGATDMQAALGRSAILVPLPGERRALGLLAISEWNRSTPFSSEEAASAEILGDHLASAIANARLYADDRRRADELALLSDITEASLEISDYARLLDNLANRLGELIEADGCVLAIWNATQQTAKTAAISSELAAAGLTADSAAVAAATCLTEAALRAGRVVPVADTAANGQADLPAAAILSLPLIADGLWLGAAHLTYREPRTFSDDELAYAERAARLIALAMSKARALEAERQRNTELQALQAASLRLTSSLDLETVLESILEQALGLAGGQDAHIFLYDGERLTFGAALWADGSQHAPFAAPRPGGLTDSVARSARRIVVPDVDQHPLFGDWRWGGAIVGLPLRSGDRICGVMNVAFTRPRQFDDNELRLLDLLADQAAVALENARLFNSEREQREMAEALRAASLALSSSLEFDSILDRLLDQIERVVPFDAAAILLAQSTGSQVQVARSRGYEAFGPAAAAWLSAAAFDPTLSANLRRMADSQRPLIVADTATDPAWSLGRASEQLHAWAGVPIVAHQQVIAFFTLDKTEIGFYGQEHADRLAAFAGQAALALQNARLFEAERRRAAQLMLLSEVSQQVTGTLDESQLLQRVVKAMIHRLGFAEAAILLPVDGRELEVVAIAATEHLAVNIGFRQRVGAGVIGRAAEIGATYLTNDISRDPYYFDPAGRAAGSALALPLKYESDVLGMLYLETSAAGAFSAADVVAYETLANHISTALQNARLYADARGRLRDMTALQSVSQTIVSSLELGDISETVVRLLRDHFGYPHVTIYELLGEHLHLKAQVGFQPDLILRDIPISSGITGRAVRTRQTQFVADVSLDTDFIPAQPDVQSEICIPLLKEPDVFGVLNVESALGQFLTAADVSLLSTLASQVTVAIQNARLFEAERDQRDLAEALRLASLELSATLDYESVLDGLLEQIGRVVPFDSANIMIVDGHRAAVSRLRGYERLGPDVVQAAGQVVFQIPAVPYLDRIARTGRPVIVSDTTTDSDWLRTVAGAHVKSWAGAPIIAQGQLTAIFSLDKEQPGYYQPIHGTRLAAFAGQAALALENARLFAAQRRRAEEQRLLLLAARDFSAALSEAAVLQAIGRHVTGALDAADCTISRWDRAGDALITLLDYQVGAHAPADEPGTNYSLADYPATRWVLLTRQPLAVEADDADADPDERRWLKQRGFARLLMVPLYIGDVVSGLLEMWRGPDKAPFSDADRQLALNLAIQAAVAFENAQLHSAVKENVRELDALLKANAALLSTLELDPLLHNILGAAMAAVPSAEMGSVALEDPASRTLRVRATSGYDDPRLLGLDFGRDQSYGAKAVRENRPLLISDVRQEPHVAGLEQFPELQAIASAIVVPLAPKGLPDAPYGIISLDSTQPKAFTDADLRILVAFANTAAVAIDNARLHAEVQRLAVTDSLTSLANPRAFEHALATEAYRAGRYGYPLSLVIMDIDSFKLFNDTFGHLAGNERLKAIANILRETVRDPDLPVRYGGEEFALLLPHTHKSGAIVLAERIREAAQAAAPTMVMPGQPMSGYTLSLGVATLPGDALSAAQLLLSADNAELAAKRTGKNRVCAAEALLADQAE